jgi:hypothetical protein
MSIRGKKGGNRIQKLGVRREKGKDRIQKSEDRIQKVGVRRKKAMGKRNAECGVRVWSGERQGIGTGG